MIRTLTIAAVMALGACASTPPVPSRPDLAALSGGLVGAWDTKAQYDAAPEALKRPPVAGDAYAWLDRQHAQFARIEAPAIGAHVIYLEWRAAGPQGAISRQRIWSFRTDAAGQVRMDFYTFKTPEPFAGKAAQAGAFAALKPEDLIGYGEACGLYVAPTSANTFDAKIDESQCQISARSGRKMGIDARVTLMTTGLLYNEAGILADGATAFKVPGGPPYEFRRAP
jgi:hypothetical protein